MDWSFFFPFFSYFDKDGNCYKSITFSKTSQKNVVSTSLWYLALRYSLPGNFTTKSKTRPCYPS